MALPLLLPSPKETLDSMMVTVGVLPVDEPLFLGSPKETFEPVAVTLVGLRLVVLLVSTSNELPDGVSSLTGVWLPSNLKRILSFSATILFKFSTP